MERKDAKRAHGALVRSAFGEQRRRSTMTDQARSDGLRLLRVVEGKFGGPVGDYTHGGSPYTITQRGFEMLEEA